MVTSCPLLSPLLWAFLVLCGIIAPDCIRAACSNACWWSFIVVSSHGGSGGGLTFVRVRFLDPPLLPAALDCVVRRVVTDVPRINRVVWQTSAYAYGGGGAGRKVRGGCTPTH